MATVAAERGPNLITILWNMDTDAGKWIETLTVSETHTVGRTDALIKFLSIYSIELIMLDEIVFVCRAADESWEPHALWCYLPHVAQ